MTPQDFHFKQLFQSWVCLTKSSFVLNLFCNSGMYPTIHCTISMMSPFIANNKVFLFWIEGMVDGFSRWLPILGMKTVLITEFFSLLEEGVALFEQPFEEKLRNPWHGKKRIVLPCKININSNTNVSKDNRIWRTCEELVLLVEECKLVWIQLLNLGVHSRYRPY